LRASNVVGALGVDPGAGARERAAVFNSVYEIDEDGVRGRYDKHHLVPGVERTPLIPAALLPALGDTTSYAVGQPEQLVISGSSGAVSLGPLVCYESAFGSLARAHVRAGAQVLVNVTNDAWFGDGLPGKAARAQHEAHLVLRAIESRIPVVRSANGGLAMVVEPSGVARAVAPAGEEGVGVVAVTTSVGPASRPGTAVASLVGPLCAAGALIVWLAGGRRRSAFGGPRLYAPKSFG
jgi:apolipoprotein N-acyltransferase